MSQISLDIEWDSPGGAKGEELRATWARLRILVDGTPVTRVEDHEGHGVRPGIFVPLYPVAEWIARNWWSLLYEVPLPRSSRGVRYGDRHNLRFAAEGFALPDLLIQPAGGCIDLEWKPFDRPLCGVTFLDRGRAVVSRGDFEASLRRFVESVVSRLDDQGVRATFLAEEWRAISKADADEEAFCRALGQLGEDPYVEHPVDGVRALIEFANLFPAETVEEFLAAVEWSRLEEAGGQLKSFTEEAGKARLDLQPLLELREKIGHGNGWTPGGGLPWQQGYEFARTLRQYLNMLPSVGVPSSAELGSLFKVRADQWDEAIAGKLGYSEHIRAAVAATSDSYPYFALRSDCESNQVFALCRGLFEYLTSNGRATGLATDAASERQKRNRAFAAEFIAPAEGIAGHIQDSTVVAGEELKQIAERFGAPEYVIRHQIQNHHLAAIREEVEV